MRVVVLLGLLLLLGGCCTHPDAYPWCSAGKARLSACQGAVRS
jgi:hypothetical protein